MKELKNCKILNNNKVIIKMVKMGMNIDETRNHRIRGIIPCDNGDYIFIEILQGTRPRKEYLHSMTKKEYEEMYPNNEYIWIDGCFRVDIPKDYQENYSKDYQKYDRKSFRELSHCKENIIKLLQNFNKNIIDIELVDNYYLDDFNAEMGFFKMYDTRLDTRIEPIKIIRKNNHYIKLKMLYTCKNYNKTIENQVFFEKEILNTSEELNKMIELYGEDTINILFEEYEETNKEFNSCIELEAK